MPDQETTPTASETGDQAPKAEGTVLSEEVKKAIKDAKGPLWKKILYWIGGALGCLGALIGILYLLKGTGPAAGIKNQVEKTKSDLAKSDLNAKLAAAESKAKEDAVKARLAEIRSIPNEYEALDELSKLIAPDAPGTSG